MGLYPEEGAVGETDSASRIVARLDRIPIWSLSFVFIGIIGLGFLFTFYDIFNINVSFIQTCMVLNFGGACPNPGAANNFLGLPVLINLVGYVVGALILSPVSDRIGRRDMLLVTMLIAGLGSLANVFVTNYVEFTAARFITGIGVGADLAIVNTYINEAAPRNGRARYTAVIFFFSSLGALLGIWLGLVLTTPGSPFPTGLPFAVGGFPPSTSYFALNGWKWMYGVGALLALFGILLRLELPESPRWLISAGRVEAAGKVVDKMEATALKRMKELPPTQEILVSSGARGIPYKELLANPTYRNRTLVLAAMWFGGYMTVYAISVGITTFLVAGAGYPPPTAGLIAALAVPGFILSAIVAAIVGEKLENKYWLPIAAVITLIGGVTLGASGNDFALSVIGANILFFGFDLWVPLAYSWSTEIYPARARATGFGLVDGVGHIGGGVGTMAAALLIASQLPLVYVFTIIALFQIISAGIGQLGIKTRAKRLDEISP